MVDPILILAWSLSWSNFGLTWSTLVNFGQTWSTSVKSFQTSRKVPSAIFWELLDAFELLLDKTRLNPTASFCMPIREKILGIKIRLWQLLLLCLALFGTKSIGQRINDSIFARLDFLGSRACPWTLWKIFLGLCVHCHTCWLSIGWHTGEKSKVDFEFLARSIRVLHVKNQFWCSLKTPFFPTSAFSFSSLLAQISQFGNPFALSFVPFFLNSWNVVFLFFFGLFFFGFCLIYLHT